MLAERDAGAFLKAAIGQCLTQIVASVGKIVAGVRDEEPVHGIRMGLRRLRTVLRELRAERYGADAAWAPLLRRADRELGRHRDREVVLPAVCSELVRAGRPAPVVAPPSMRSLSPEEVFRAPGFQQTLTDMHSFVQRPDAAGSTRAGGQDTLRTELARRLDRLHRVLARDGRRFRELASSRQHRVRKRLGRMLCLGELAAPLFDSERAARYLGEWHRAEQDLSRNADLRTASELFGTRALSTPAARSDSHWLKRRRRDNARCCQRSLRRAAKTAVFWRP